MDEWWLLDDTLMEDDFSCCELVVVDACLLDDGVTVTVIVDFAPLLHSDAPCEARGAAAASPNREAMKILECILSKKERIECKDCVKDSVSEDADYQNQKSRE